MPVDAARTQAALLGWYDLNARALPWRIPPGDVGAPDPYLVWLSEIMLQQTTVAAAAPYFERFLARWPTVAALAAADDADLMAAWAGLGYYARARNLLACARRIVAEHDGRFPDEEAALRELPGVGAYTAAAIAAIAFGRRAVVVDANVERVAARLFAVTDPVPQARRHLRELADALTPSYRTGDFAQAMMDLGAAICTPRTPRCSHCPVSAMCMARATGDPSAYPVRSPKRAKHRRHGIAYWLEADGRVLLSRRPPAGLLGGMRALPGGAWGERAVEAPPASADWRALGTVNHVFTHFALTLEVRAARADRTDDSGEWWPVDRLHEAGLPTLYARAATLARAK